VIEVKSEWAEKGEERTYWECTCGRAGSSVSYRWETHSDKHIDYAAGDRRVDRSTG
jgi:hypothetical protein